MNYLKVIHIMRYTIDGNTSEKTMFSMFLSGYIEVIDILKTNVSDTLNIDGQILPIINSYENMIYK